MLGATRFAADDFVRANAKRGFLGVHRMTLRQLASHLSLQSIAERGLAPVSSLGQEALAARVVHLAKGKLRYFAPVADTPGFAVSLASTLNELRLQAVSIEALAKTGAPGQDLAVLLELYDGELKERRLADLALILHLAADVANARGHRLTGLPLVLLEVPLESKLHETFAAALFAHAPSVVATVLDGEQRVMERLLGVTAVAIGAGPQRCLDHVRGNLFATQLSTRCDFDDSLQIFSTPGEGLESVEIARRIRALATDGVAFDEIAILLRAPDRYQPLLEEALRRAGIPAYFTRGSRRPDPAGRAFLALLACAAEGTSASRFAEYLSLGQVPEIISDAASRSQFVMPDEEELKETSEDEPSPALPIGWEKLLIDAAVIGGKDRWAKRLHGLQEELKLQVQSMDPDDPRKQYRERQAAQLDTLQGFALPLIAMLTELPRESSWGEWLAQLAALAEASLRQPEGVLSVLAELEPMSEVGPVGLEEVRGVLSERLGQLRREMPSRRYGHVFITSIEEARGRTFRVVFLPGLAEGVFPKRVFEDPLLLDEYRKPLDAGLLLRTDKAANERRLLRYAVAAAGERLFVSYPRMDVAQARPRVPSFYALEFPRVVRGTLPDLHEFERSAMQSAPARLGWPAPADPMQAVDDAEYDLAYLYPYLDKKIDQRSRARYIMEANPHLARSMRTRWRRWQPKWDAVDGMVASDAATTEILAAHRLRARAYSPSSLQNYATCPYKFYLQAIFQLRPREEAAALEQLDPLTRGEIFHRVQFELFNALRSDGLLPVGPDNLGPALALANEVLDRVAARYEDDLAPAIPRVWHSEIDDIRADLRGWLGRSDPQWTPNHFEFAFGLAPSAAHDAASTVAYAEAPNGARLRGSIDLVERHSGGHLRVTDHKTGKPPDKIPLHVGGGKLLQPLLYALAAEKLLGAPVDSGRLYYCTQRGGYTAVQIPLNPTSRERIAKVTQIVDDAIGGGFLPAAPESGACGTCDYAVVCGPYEELRVRRKEQSSLEPLLELRNMP